MNAEPVARRQFSQWQRTLANGGPVSWYWILPQRQLPEIRAEEVEDIFEGVVMRGEKQIVDESEYL